MKILYGVQGTGNGHITRARAMAKVFNDKGIKVDFLFSGRATDSYFDMEVFGDHRCFRGLSFVTEAGKVDVWQTYKTLSFSQFIKDVRALDVRDYDLILNDFEPITAWAAKRAGKDVINISHQASFFDKQIPLPGFAPMHRLLLKWFAPSSLTLGVHWQPFGGHILPPFIEVESREQSPLNYALVYLPFENLAGVLSLLKQVPEQQFVVYHPDINAESTDQNCELMPLHRTKFLTALQQCQGVICNAGFELSSEAMKLGKKILLKPLAGQFEQKSNAQLLASMEIASVTQQLTVSDITQWLEINASTKISFPNDPSPLIDWLMAGDYQAPETLCAQLWQNVVVEKQCFSS